MSVMKVMIASFAGLLLGTLTGLIFGYSLWGQGEAQTASLNHELEKTRSWLLDEINWSDERCEQVATALTKAQTDLTQVRRELERTRGLVPVTARNAESERARARELSEAASPGSAR
jgi:hypothetical protein